MHFYELYFSPLVRRVRLASLNNNVDQVGKQMRHHEMLACPMRPKKALLSEAFKMLPTLCYHLANRAAFSFRLVQCNITTLGSLFLFTEMNTSITNSWKKKRWMNGEMFLLKLISQISQASKKKSSEVVENLFKTFVCPGGNMSY